jgi:hypothetical protein
MRIRSITGAAGVALGLAMTAGVALAQTGPSIGGPTSPGTQRQLLNSPGYSVGTGSAHIGGPTNPTTQQQLLTSPGYSVGTGAAQIGGPTSPATQQQLLNTPGYTVGTGSSKSWPAYCYTTSRAELRNHTECEGAPHE